jgi:hypothetical protein
MSVLAAPAPVLSGVDLVLTAITTDAVSADVAVTAGPLDRPVSGTRLNWFLYRITPAAAYLNMEPPQSGWTTRRGRPPLALTLHYLLSGDPGEMHPTGNEIEAVHDALTAVMLVLHENPILGPETVITAPPNRTVRDVATALDHLVEPLRITLDPVPLETVTGLWASGLKSLRVSVAYQVSLLLVPSPVPFAPGPPVLEPVVAVSPSPGPHISAVVPPLASVAHPVLIAVRGLGEQLSVELSRSPGDPDDPTDGRPNPATTRSTGPWRLTATRAAAGLSVTLPNAQLVPANRVLTVTNLASGRPAGSASAALTVAPTISSAGAPLQAGQTATLQVAHVLAIGTVNFLGMSVPYTKVGATSVTAAVPTGVGNYAGQNIPVTLTSGTVTGTPTDLAVAP